MIQVVVDSSLAPPAHVMPTGTCILVEGAFQKPSLFENKKHTIELKADKLLHLGTVDHDRYPLTKRRLPLELLRDSAHFRPRTTTVASVMRIRNGLTQAAFAFFRENAFLHVQAPVTTVTDASGGNGENLLLVSAVAALPDGVEVEAIRASIKEKRKKVEELKRSDSNKEALAVAVMDLKKATELVEADQRRSKTYLSVSGRLHLESHASALGNVFSFGPRFRVSALESKKVLAEMWMVEIEVAFSELEVFSSSLCDFFTDFSVPHRL